MNDGTNNGKPMTNLRLAPRQKAAELIAPASNGLLGHGAIRPPAPRKHLDDIFAPSLKRPQPISPITADSFRNLKDTAPLARDDLRKIAAAQQPAAPLLSQPRQASVAVTAAAPKHVRAPVPLSAPTPRRAPPAPVPAAPVQAAPPSQAARAVQPPANDQGVAASKMNENFGAFVLALAETTRYRHIGLGELISQFFEPMQRDRVAIALAGQSEEEARTGKPSAFIMWASVSPEVDEKIREQVTAGVFPLRLKPEDWNSGSINWLLDVVATSPQMRTAALTSFVQSKRLGELRLHPIINRLVDAQTLANAGIAPRLEDERKTA